MNEFFGVLVKPKEQRLLCISTQHLSSLKRSQLSMLIINSFIVTQGLCRSLASSQLAALLDYMRCVLPIVSRISDAILSHLQLSDDLLPNLHF